MDYRGKGTYNPFFFSYHNSPIWKHNNMGNTDIACVLIILIMKYRVCQMHERKYGWKKRVWVLRGVSEIQSN